MFNGPQMQSFNYVTYAMFILKGWNAHCVYIYLYTHVYTYFIIIDRDNSYYLQLCGSNFGGDIPAPLQ